MGRCQTVTYPATVGPTSVHLKRVPVRKPNGKTYVYLKLVKAVRNKDRVTQEIVANLGREDRLKASGELDRLAAAFARRDPPLLGSRREVGPLLLVRHYLERLQLAQIVDRHLPLHGRAQLTNGEVVLALIANRLCAPSPLYDISGWASSAALQELFGIPAMLLNDDRLGRLLDDFAKRAESIRGAVALAAIERFGVEAGRLHLDLTSLRIYGAHEQSSLVAVGWNQERRLERQVKALEAVTPGGIPLYVRPEKGNAAELKAVGQALERLAELLPPGLLICTDSALGHLKTICEADQAGLRFVIPLREATGFRTRFRAQVGGTKTMAALDYCSYRERDLKAEKRTRYRGQLSDWEVVHPENHQMHRVKVAYIWSSEEEQSVREGRERALQRAEEALTRIQRGLGGPYYKTATDVSRRVGKVVGKSIEALLELKVGEVAGKPTLSYCRLPEVIAREEELDGVYALATNLPDVESAADLLRIYKDQALVELRHRDLKGSLRVRPIFLHNDDRIAALISIVGLAALLFGLIELDLRKALGENVLLDGLLPEGRAARPTGRNILSAFQGLGLTYGGGRRILLDRLTNTQRRILNLLNVPLPWPEQPGKVSPR
jgi:transposase